MKTKRVAVTMTVLLVTMLLLLPTTASAQTASNQNKPDPGFGLNDDHANMQSQINSSNVSQLKPAWNINTDDPVSAVPIVQNGDLYFTDWGDNVYSLDATSGKTLWKVSVGQPNSKWPWHGLAGTGVLSDGVYVVASVEGMAYALNPDNGKVLWKTDISQGNQYAGTFQRISAYNGMVYIGLSSVEEPLSKMKADLQLDFMGAVVALDIHTGKQVWKFQTVQSPANGVAVWGGFAFDPQMNAVFFGTGNNYSGSPSDLSDSVIALNASNGQMLWHKQVLSNDVWLPVKSLGPDFDFGDGPQLFDVNSSGQTRQLVGIGQKSGIYWALDRKTGDIVWQTQLGYADTGGGMRGSASYANGKLFAWSNVKYADSGPKDHPINVDALDAATGKILWSDQGVQAAVATAAGMLSNNVYFVGALDGSIHAYDAASGKLLWSNLQTFGPVDSSLVQIGNTLFFGVGIPASFGGGPKSNGMVAFALNGKVDLTQSQPTTQPSPTPVPTNGPSQKFPETGYTVSGQILQFWQTNGGLPVFGYPIGPEQMQNGMDFQPFQRTVLEIHPNNPTPYQVEIRRLGVELLQARGIDWMTLPKASSSAPHYFAQTGHAVAPQFWSYWSSHGLKLGNSIGNLQDSIALFGYPISEPKMETNASGDTVLTQWFERARFEYHPNNPAPYQVELGLIGSEYQNQSK